jgi:hypothetical protein
MPLSRLILAGLSTALLAPTAAFAQMCRGAPPLAGNSVAQVGAAASLFDGGNTIGGGVTAGSTLFVSGAGAYTTYDLEGLSLKSVGGSVGYEVQTATDGRLSICPTMNVSYAWGLEVAGIDLSTLSYTPAVAASWRVDLEPNVVVVPAVELSLIHERLTGDDGTGSTTVSDTYGAYLMAVSFQFRMRWAVTPNVQIPIAAEGGSAVLGIGLTYAIGGGT